MTPAYNIYKPCNMSRIFLWVAIGGAIGSLARYLISIYLFKASVFSFPWGTFAVNIIGCFLIGVFYALSEKLNISTEWQLFLTTGVCGGFTTFSTFAFENLKLLQEGQYFYFATYSTASFALGLAAVFFGIYTIKTIIL